MHVMFIHPNFPGQFGHLAYLFATALGWKCTFVTGVDTTHLQLPFQHLNYRIKPGTLPDKYYNPGNIQNHLDHLNAIYFSLRDVPRIKPDLVVGHVFYGTMLLLRNLYRCPFLGYFEVLPPPFWSDSFILRKEFPPTEDIRLGNAAYHSLVYLHLHAVEAAYTPTRYQHSAVPRELQHKVRVVHDGIDADFFQPRAVSRPTTFRGVAIDKDTRVVTYVAPGLESTRGFDIFMKTAKIIAREMPTVIFLIAGHERTNYGFELHHLPRGVSFKQWVLSQDDYDLSRFHFLDWVPTAELPQLFNLSDLHFYLTVPFTLSWSMLQAMASGCTILASATAPVQEVADDGVHALLSGFYDVDELASRALQVLRDPKAYRGLGQAARARVLERYETRKCTAQLADFFLATRESYRRD